MCRLQVIYMYTGSDGLLTLCNTLPCTACVYTLNYTLLFDAFLWHSRLFEVGIVNIVKGSCILPWVLGQLICGRTCTVQSTVIQEENRLQKLQQMTVLAENTLQKLYT